MQIIQNMKSFLKTIENIGGDARELRVDKLAEEQEIVQVEKDLGVSIPIELRNAMLQFSSHLEFKWFLNDSIKIPQKFNEIFCGEIHWGLDMTSSFMQNYRGWIKEVFPNPEDPYDIVWHNKFPFQEVGNGDFLSIDSFGKVIYLSHDDGEGHGFIMANSFYSLLENWLPLGCPGGEDWQWLPFTNNMTTPIDPNSSNGKEWLSMIGIK
jgi:hypothetical protein